MQISKEADEDGDKEKDSTKDKEKDHHKDADKKRLSTRPSGDKEKDKRSTRPSSKDKKDSKTKGDSSEDEAMYLPVDPLQCDAMLSDVFNNSWWCCRDSISLKVPMRASSPVLRAHSAAPAAGRASTFTSAALRQEPDHVEEPLSGSL